MVVTEGSKGVFNRNLTFFFHKPSMPEINLMFEAKSGWLWFVDISSRKIINEPRNLAAHLTRVAPPRPAPGTSKKKMVFRGEEMWKLSFLQVSIQKFLSDWITWASNVAFSHCTASAFYSSTDPKQWGQKRGLKNKAPKSCSCLFARIHRGMCSTREDSHVHPSPKGSVPVLSIWQKARPGLAMGVSWYINHQGIKLSTQKKMRFKL